MLLALRQIGVSMRPMEFATTISVAHSTLWPASPAQTAGSIVAALHTAADGQYHGLGSTSRVNFSKTLAGVTNET